MHQQARQLTAAGSRRPAALALLAPRQQHQPAYYQHNHRRRRAPCLLLRASASAAAVAEQSAPQQQEQKTAPTVLVRPLSSESELWAVARLRAEAYHEGDSSRFAATFKKQFAEREAASLRQRTAAPAAGGGGVRCECLVAVENKRQQNGGEEEDDDDDNDAAAAAGSSTGGGAVLGCIDLRPPPHAAATPSSSGVPPEDAARGAYLLNVVVAEQARGQGVGAELMRAAMRRAREAHGASRAYTHVEAGNAAAARMYARCGFRESGEERGALSGASELGRVLLLRAELSGQE